MITLTVYLKPNITIESEFIGSKEIYVYNYKGVHYRVFHSVINLQDFIVNGSRAWDFECNNEKELDEYLV